MRNILFLIAASLCLLAGCKKSPPRPEALFETEWKLVRYTAGFGQTYPIEGSRITLRFESDSLFGRAGCNEYFGNWAYRGVDRLLVSGQIGTTEQYCDGYMQQEQLYLNLLSTAAHFIAGDTFLQLSGPQGVLFFANEYPTAKQETVLTGYFVAGNEVSTFRDCADPSAVFWLEDETNTLAALYAALTGGGEAYRPVLLEIEAARLPRLNLGYASEYDGLIRVKEVRRIALPDPEDLCFKLQMTKD